MTAMASRGSLFLMGLKQDLTAPARGQHRSATSDRDFGAGGHEALHDVAEVAEGLHLREVLVGHADVELLFEEADELHDRDGVEAELADHGVLREAVELLAVHFEGGLREELDDVDG